MTAVHVHAVRYASVAVLDGMGPGTELLDARFVRHVFPRHSHDAYALGLVLEGRTRFFARGEWHTAGAGNLLLHDAGSVHTGEPGGEEGWRHRMIYLAPELLAYLITPDDRGAAALPSFREPLAADPGCARQFLSTFAALSRAGHDPLAAGEALHEFAQSAMGRFASRGTVPPPAPASASVRALDRVRERIEAHCTHAGWLDLHALAGEAGLSPTHLITAFRRRFGLPPAAFALQCRVRHARALLACNGLPLATVAAEAGFYDQSDLSRHFVRHLGLPPGTYRRQRRIIQDRPSHAGHTATPDGTENGDGRHDAKDGGR